ncbi:UNVERIFIED_CONTAM: hypothetical protein Sradi_2381800, partial [Sesamum radiatum]
GYVLDKPLPVTLPEGSSPEERLTFEKWHVDNRKFRSIILASMTNKIQKQYDRLEDVPSIMLCMKDVYAVPDRHIRYAATKAFFRTKMTEGLSVHSHGVKMLSLVEKLEDLKVGLDNDTYIDATTHKSEPAVLVGEASTSKAKDKGARRWKRKKDKGTAVTATASTGGAPPAARRERAKGRLGVLRCQRQMMSACIAKKRGVAKKQKLSKDEMILRLGDGKAVAAEAVGSLRLVVSSHIRIDLKDIYFVPSHISEDRIRRLVDSKSLEIDNLDHLPICESCLKEKMTKKPFVGQSAIANVLLDLVHTDVCGPLSIPARGGFSYFITFTDDHSWYGYIYLMRYKSEAFGRFKDYRLEVENQTNRKIKAIRSAEVWNPLGTPLLNRVAERRNRTLLDMVRSMMSFTELPPSFWGYAVETAAKLLNIAPSKFIEYLKETAGYYFYDPAEQKIFISKNAIFLEKGFPSDSRHDEALIEESNKEPHCDTMTSFEPTVHTDSVPVLRRSTKESRVPDRYILWG